jgi:hypothetical protein
MAFDVIAESQEQEEGDQYRSFDVQRMTSIWPPRLRLEPIEKAAKGMRFEKM